MNWKELWMTLFGTTEWLGLNIDSGVAFSCRITNVNSYERPIFGL